MNIADDSEQRVIEVPVPHQKRAEDGHPTKRKSITHHNTITTSILLFDTTSEISPQS